MFNKAPEVLDNSSADSHEEWIGVTQEEIKTFAKWGLGVTAISALGAILSMLLGKQ